MAAEAGEVETSALTTASLLARRGSQAPTSSGRRGPQGPGRAGVEVVDGEPDRVDVVVVGWDRRADYASLRTASVLVQRGAWLVATNDASYPPTTGCDGRVQEPCSRRSRPPRRAVKWWASRSLLLLAALERPGAGGPC